MLGLFCWKTEGVSHCTKKHISQVLEYDEKFKNTKKTSTFQIKERPYFLSLESSKQELFHTKKTWYFMVKKISSYINFLNQKEDRISHLRKFQNKNFPVFRKLGILCWRKYHLTSTFWIKIRPYFPSPKSLKQELFRIQKTWYSMLKKISSYINFLNQKKTVFPINEKFKTRTSP